MLKYIPGQSKTRKYIITSLIFHLVLKFSVVNCEGNYTKNSFEFFGRINSPHTHVDAHYHSRYALFELYIPYGVIYIELKMEITILNVKLQSNSNSIMCWFQCDLKFLNNAKKFPFEPRTFASNRGTENALIINPKPAAASIWHTFESAQYHTYFNMERSSCPGLVRMSWNQDF